MADHDRKLVALFERCRARCIRLNKDKLRLHRESVSYMGHLITKYGLQPDNAKIEAIKRMPHPEDKAGVQRLLGMATYLAKFVPNFSEVTAPLRSLLEKSSDFRWDKDVHGQALEKLKDLLQSTPVLKYFDVTEAVTVQCDASQHGLGSCLLSAGKPVAYASRALTPTEQHYAQIEKELLSICYALEKFHSYVYGRHDVTVETDHKPLISIMKKSLTSAPRRLQRMLLRLQNYSFNLVFKPGKQIVIADTLSRAFPVRTSQQSTSESEHFEEDIANVDDETMITPTQLVASAKVQNMIRSAAAHDNIYMLIKKQIKIGWPDRPECLPQELREFFPFCDELVVDNDFIFKGSRLFVPAAARPEIVERAHSSHIGINGCIRRAREVVFWPKMAADIGKSVSQCTTCEKFQSDSQKEPLLPHPTPERPWSRLATDIFEFKHQHYLVTVDYFSNYFEVDRLDDKKSKDVIYRLKQQFARHGIPSTLVTDNGPPFNSSEFRLFSSRYEFDHVTSSPKYPQSNGKAENAVKTAKRLMKKASDAGTDPFLALLDWRNTPSESLKESPAQMLFGRRTRTLLPISNNLLQTPKDSEIKSRLRDSKQKQAHYYNRNAKDKPQIHTGQTVRAQIKDSDWVKAEVDKCLPFRSYVVRTEDGATYRRNRRHVRISDEKPIVFTYPDDEPMTALATTATDIQPEPEAAAANRGVSPARPIQKTRYGREIRRPARYQE